MMLDNSTSSDGAESDTEDIEIEIALPIRTHAPPPTPVTEVNPFEDVIEKGNLGIILQNWQSHAARERVLLS